jgi:hypothetical protein
MYFFIAQQEITCDPESHSPVLRVLEVRFAEVTFGKTQVIDSIEQIGFANPIFTTYAYYALTKIKRLIQVVFELQ